LRKASVSATRPASPQLRIGAIGKAVVAVLAAATEPMHVSEIHCAVENQLGQSVNYRSVKSYLSAETFKAEPKFHRTAYGHY
jgi:hypothetical protein